jgi:Inhibitor of Apoptosis domain
MNYCSELERLYTYPVKWPYGHPKEELVRSGFFSVGGSNTVECFACKLRINVQQQEFKNVKDKHKERKPDCPMNINPSAVKNVAMKHTNIYK